MTNHYRTINVRSPHMATQDVDLESSHECVAILNIKDLGLDNFIAAYTIINTKVSLSF